MAVGGKKSAKPAKPQAVVDLKAIEDELNRDPDAQAAFTKNPSRFLEERGLKVRAKDKAELKNLTQELTAGPQLAPGSDLAAGIRIVIRRRF